jgi:hypothetical protein
MADFIRPSIGGESIDGKSQGGCQSAMLGAAFTACALTHETADEKKPQRISALGFFSYN